MNRRSLIQLLPIGVLPLAASCARTPQRIQKGQNIFYYGHITSGEYHGVLIGEDRKVAKAKLRAMGLLDYGVDTCEKGLAEKIECKLGEVVDVYRRHGFFRSGLVYLFVESERITRIAWSYSYSIDT